MKMESIQEIVKIKDLEKSVNRISDFIRDKVSNRFQKSGAIVGLSGGIDSAVTAALCARSLE